MLYIRVIEDRLADVIWKGALAVNGIAETALFQACTLRFSYTAMRRRYTVT